MLGQGLFARLHGAVAGVLGRVGGCYRAGAVQACPGVAAVSLVWRSRGGWTLMGLTGLVRTSPGATFRLRRQPSTCKEPDWLLLAGVRAATDQYQPGRPVNMLGRKESLGKHQTTTAAATCSCAPGQMMGRKGESSISAVKPVPSATY